MGVRAADSAPLVLRIQDPLCTDSKYPPLRKRGGTGGLVRYDA
jgi:hypothetical protein